MNSEGNLPSQTEGEPAATTKAPLPGEAAKGKDAAMQALKFTLLSISAGLVEAASFALLEWLTPLPYAWTHFISITLSVIYNFTLNRRYTFKSANNVPIAMVKVAVFYAFFIPITMWLGALAANAGVNDFIIKGVTMILNFIGEFAWWKWVVFRGTENTNDLARK